MRTTPMRGSFVRVPHGRCGSRRPGGSHLTLSLSESARGVTSAASASRNRFNFRVEVECFFIVDSGKGLESRPLPAY